MPKPLSAVLIGAGNRGHAVYGAYALARPDEIRFTAVAEPHKARRVRFAQAHGILPEHQFSSWEDLLTRGQIADTALVCTLDRTHVAPTIAALRAGYDVLLEKPMATSLADCVRLVRMAERTGRLLQICHVLRYTSFFSTLHSIIQSGRLGDIITVEHRENVIYWHMAHSFVRGNWRNSQVESPMILSKCCHDLDILHWNLGLCARLGSLGSLTHYRRENAPSEAPERCTDGCPVADSCPWYAPRLYVDLVPLMHVARHMPPSAQQLGATLSLRYPRATNTARRLIPPLNVAFDYRDWPISVISEDTSPEARRRALETGPYGRCVYHCDNDVVDHQIVSMELESGTSVALIMHGHSHEESRTMRYDGTRATLLGKFAYGLGDTIEIHDHHAGTVERIHPRAKGGGHGGGDEGLMSTFIQAARNPSTAALTSARESLESHILAFAAERARVEGTVVNMRAFRSEAERAGQEAG